MSNNKRRFFLRYISIIQKLRSNPASFDEIESFLKRQSRDSGEDLSISKRTFQRDLNDIREIFDIDIRTDSSNNYFVSDEGDLARRLRVLKKSISSIFFTERKIRPDIFITKIDCRAGVSIFMGFFMLSTIIIL